MYLPSLVSLVRANPLVSDATISAIDDFLGEMSESGVFRQSDLAAAMPQKKLATDVLRFLQEGRVIEPISLKCRNCGREDQYGVRICEQCGSDVDPANDTYRYRLVHELNISQAEKSQREQSRRRLLLSSFKMLLARVEKKRKTGEAASIILLDLANSTELSKKNVYLMSHIKREFVEILRDHGGRLLRNHKGLFLKADGDSAFVYVNDIGIAVEFFREFLAVFEVHPCFERIRQINAEGHVGSEGQKLTTYIKAFHSSSKIVEYFRPDELSLDFTTMEAFTVNNRVEKKAKPLIESHFGLDRIFPMFVCSTIPLPIPNTVDLVLNDVLNLGSVPIHVNMAADFVIHDRPSDGS